MNRFPLSRCRLRIDVVGSHESRNIVGLPRLDSAREEDVVVVVVAAVAAVVVVVVVVVIVVLDFVSKNLLSASLYYLYSVILGRVGLTSLRTRV